MSDQDNKPASLDAAIAAQIHAARIRGAYSIEALAALAQTDPAAIKALEDGATIADVSARDRVMDVLGLRPDSHRYPARPTDLSLRTRD